MNTYLIAYADIFNGTNVIYKITAENKQEAILKLLVNMGWDVSSGYEETLDQINDILLSDPSLE
jgi:KaiC/GvpD/RAD55 family RecA-like ATPase